MVRPSGLFVSIGGRAAIEFARPASDYHCLVSNIDLSYPCQGKSYFRMVTQIF